MEATVSYVNLCDKPVRLQLRAGYNSIIKLSPRAAHLDPIRIEETIVEEKGETYTRYRLSVRPPRKEGVVYILWKKEEQRLDRCFLDKTDDIIAGAGKLNAVGDIELRTDIYSGVQTRGMSKNEAELLWATRDKAWHKVASLVESGTNVNIKDGCGYTPLHWACWELGKDNTDRPRAMIRLLLAHGADVNIGDSLGYTPLDRACMYGDKEILRLLMHHGANVGARGSRNTTPLHMACMGGHLDVAQTLIEDCNIDPDVREKYGFSPLYEACYSGNVDLARFLIENGADVNMKDAYDGAPLHRACACGCIDLVRVLLENGADVEKRCSHISRSPCPYKPPKNPDIQDNINARPLEVAFHFGHADIVRLLLEHGADPNIRDTVGLSPLHWLSRWGRVDIVRLLLDAGADVNIGGINGNTPLHFACWKGRAAIARLLLEHGADPHAHNIHGYDPLVYALSYIYVPKKDTANLSKDQLKTLVQNDGKNEIINMYKERYPDSRETWVRSLNFDLGY